MAKITGYDENSIGIIKIRSEQFSEVFFTTLDFTNHDWNQFEILLTQGLLDKRQMHFQTMLIFFRSFICFIEFSFLFQFFDGFFKKFEKFIYLFKNELSTSKSMFPSGVSYIFKLLNPKPFI